MHSRGERPANNADAHIITRCSATAESADGFVPDAVPFTGIANRSFDIYMHPQQLQIKQNHRTTVEPRGRLAAFSRLCQCAPSQILPQTVQNLSRLTPR